MKKIFALVFAVAMIFSMAFSAFASDVVIEYNTAYVLKFDCDDEVEIAFGGDGDNSNEGVFTVDVSGMNKLFVAFDTDPNESIAAANEGAQMYFVNFNGIQFNRSGEYVYELEGAAAAYQIVDNKLVEIPDVKIADDEIVFKTRVLGNYVFAKSALVNPA